MLYHTASFRSHRPRGTPFKSWRMVTARDDFNHANLSTRHFQRGKIPRRGFFEKTWINVVLFALIVTIVKQKRWIFVERGGESGIGSIPKPPLCPPLSTSLLFLVFRLLRPPTRDEVARREIEKMPRWPGLYCTYVYTIY